MPVGLPITKQELDTRSGTIASAFQDAFNDALTLQQFLLATPNADLEAIGYTPEEVASLKTAFADLAHLARVWAGQDALPDAKDFRVFVSRLWGLGAF